MPAASTMATAIHTVVEVGAAALIIFKLDPTSPFITDVEPAVARRLITAGMTTVAVLGVLSLMGPRPIPRTNLATLAWFHGITGFFLLPGAAERATFPSSRMEKEVMLPGMIVHFGLAVVFAALCLVPKAKQK